MEAKLLIAGIASVFFSVIFCVHSYEREKNGLEMFVMREFLFGISAILAGVAVFIALMLLT